MENNEQQEFTPDQSELDASIDESNEVVNQDESSDEEKDWKAEALKYKAIAERKQKQIEKQPEVQQPQQSNSTNQNATAGVTREEVIFLSKGYDSDDLELAHKIAKVQGTSVLASMEDDYFKSVVKKKRDEANAKNSQLGPGGGSPMSGGKRQKPISQMTRDEHMEYFNKRISE